MEQPGWGRWGAAAPGPAGAGPEGVRGPDRVWPVLMGGAGRLPGHFDFWERCISSGIILEEIQKQKGPATAGP